MLAPVSADRRHIDSAPNVRLESGSSSGAGDCKAGLRRRNIQGPTRCVCTEKRQGGAPFLAACETFGCSINQILVGHVYEFALKGCSRRLIVPPMRCLVLISNEPRKFLRLSEIDVNRLTESWIPALIECDGLVQNDPGDSGELVCQRDNKFVGVHSGFQANQLRPEAIPGPVWMHHATANTVDQKTPHITITAFTHPKQRCLADGQILRRGKPELGGKIPYGSELLAAPNRRDDCGCRQLSDARHSYQTSRKFALVCNRCNFCGHSGDAIIQDPEVLPERFEQAPA